MQLRRLSVGIACAAATLALAAPAGAQAASGTVVIVSAGLNVNSGALTVTAQATSSITTISVEIVSQSTASDALTVTSFTPPADLTDGTWTATVTSAELAPGAYYLNVAAADQDGDSATATDIGAVDWFGTAEPTLTASTGTISYGNNMVTLSGTVSYSAPGGAAPQPDPGVMLNLYSDYGSVAATLGPTAADGTFSQSVALTPGMYYAEPTGLTDTFIGASTDVTESATPDPVRMTARETPYKSDYGQKVTVSGTLTYQSGSKWLPLAGQPVTVGLPLVGGQATTNAAGVFTFVIKAVEGGQWTAYSYADSAESGLLTFPSTENTGYLKVAELVKFHWFRAARRPRRHVSVAGCIAAADYGLSQGEPGPRVDIQYRTRTSGAWHNLGRIALEPGSIVNSCNVENADIYFHSTFATRASKAYYRAYYPGEWIAGTYSGFAPGASRAVHVTV
jgi:hypothetical protein